MEERGPVSALLRWRAKKGGTPSTEQLHCTPGVGTGLQSHPEGQGCLEIGVDLLCSHYQDHTKGSFLPPKLLEQSRAGTRVPEQDCAPAAVEVVRGGGTQPRPPGMQGTSPRLAPSPGPSPGS